MYRSRLMVATFLLLACVISYPTFGQQPTGERGVFSDEVQVDLVNIEVHVSRRGLPVKGLGPDDFEMYEDGQPVEITNFCAVENGAIVLEASGGEMVEHRIEKAQPPAGPAPESRMDMVVYIDLMFSRSKGLRQTLPEVGAFLGRHLRDGDRAMVVVYNGRVKVMTPFTEDREVLQAAVEEVRNMVAIGNMFDADTLLTLQMLGSLERFSRGAKTGNSLSEKEIEELVTAEIRAGSERGRLLITRALRALHSMVALLSSGVPGRKSILLVGDGIPVDVNQGLAQALYPREQLHTGTLLHSPLYQWNVIDAANASGVTIHTISAEGLSIGSDTGVITPDVAGWDVRGKTDAIRLQRFTDEVNSLGTVSEISESTGGLTIFKANPKTMKAVANDLDSLYSIGIRPADPDAGGNRRLEVKVRRKGVDVRHRYGYQPLSEKDRLAASTIAALAIDPQSNPLELHCEVGDQARMAEDGLYVPLTFKIPVQRLALTPDGDSWKGQLSVLLVGRKDIDKLSPMKQLSFPLNVPVDPYTDGEGKVITFSAELLLPPGESTVAVTAYDVVAKVAATITTELQLDQSGRIVTAGG